MEEIVIQFTGRVFADADKQYVGGKDWNGIFGSTGVFLETVALPTGEVIAEKITVDNIHVHVGQGCTDCVEESNDGIG